MRLIDADEMAKNESEAYISAQAKITSPVTLGLNSVVHRKMQQLIADTPTIDPESLRPLGVWVGEADGYADGELVYDVWYCSDCNYCIDDGTDDPTLLPNYCPNCGAFMKGEKI